METEGSLPLSQMPAACPYPEPDPVHNPTSQFLKNHLNIILPFTLGSVQVRGLLYEYFVTAYVLTVRSCWHLAQPPSWRTTPYQMPVNAYSIYSQLPSIFEAVPPSATCGRAIPC